jgi:hypothetical protein
VVPDAVGVASVGAGLLVTSLVNELTSPSGVGGALTLVRGIWTSGWRAIFGGRRLRLDAGCGAALLYMDGGGWRGHAKSL